MPALGGARTLRRYLYPARLPIGPPRGSYGSIVASSDGDTKSCSVFRKVEAKNRRDQHRDRDHERRPEHEQEEVDHAFCSSFVAAKSCERGPKRSMISGKAYPTANRRSSSPWSSIGARPRSAERQGVACSTRCVFIRNRRRGALFPRWLGLPVRSRRAVSAQSTQRRRVIGGSAVIMSAANFCCIANACSESLSIDEMRNGSPSGIWPVRIVRISIIRLSHWLLTT